LREVAEHAQVAMSSVSRVLTDHPDVSDRMRRRVLAAAEELGYEPDLLAQSLRRGETFSIGFVVRDISNPILAEIALGAETTLSEAGYSMLLANSHGEADRDAAGIRLFRRRRVDGLLLSLSDELHEPTRTEIEHLQAPIVLIDRELPGAPPVSAVLSDHGAGVRAAVERMVELGHRRFGLVSGEGRIFPMRTIESTMREVCERANAELLVERGPMLAEDGRAETERLLDRDDPPTALLTGSNQILVGTLHALRDRGLRVPDDVSLVTFDDIPLLDLLDPPIAVISRLPAELGRRAAELLLTHLRDGDEARVVTTPTTFDPRGSIGSPPR
jgi:LacI family transcriptional regulator, galactose operon repressor